MQKYAFLATRQDITGKTVPLQPFSDKATLTVVMKKNISFPFLTTMCLLFCVHLFGNDSISDPDMFMKGDGFPIIETPSVFKSTIGDRDFLVFVEYSDSLNIKGHYMSLEETMTDTLPFKLEAEGHNAILYYEDHEEVFDTADFLFQIHEAPTFQDFGNKRYQDSLFAVEKISDICYGNSPGFWLEIDDSVKTMGKLLRVVDVRRTVPLDLLLDIYKPQNDTLEKHPLVMLIYGGAYYFGSKDDVKITNMCRYLASLGYVVASIDHRLGFFPGKASIGRAAYRAVQDAHAAMRFLVSHPDDYGIDTSMIFVGGSSSGAVTALSLAFMTNEGRPKYARKGLFRPDLGDIDTCGNVLRTKFRIRGVAEMWGAISDTSALRRHDISILAFHGDADDIMPYEYGRPFSVAKPFNRLAADPMFGASCIVDRATKLGYRARLVTFSGYKHMPHVDPKTKVINDNFYVVRDTMSEFFHDIIVPQKLEIEGEDGHYYVNPCPLKASWTVEGGVILSTENNTVDVAWIKNTPHHSITVSAVLPYGVGLTETKDVREFEEMLNEEIEGQK